MAVQVGRAQRETARLAAIREVEQAEDSLHEEIVRSVSHVAASLAGARDAIDRPEVARRIEEAMVQGGATSAGPV